MSTKPIKVGQLWEHRETGTMYVVDRLVKSPPRHFRLVVLRPVEGGPETGPWVTWRLRPQHWYRGTQKRPLPRPE